MSDTEQLYENISITVDYKLNRITVSAYGRLIPYDFKEPITLGHYCKVKLWVEENLNQLTQHHEQENEDY